MSFSAGSLRTLRSVEREALCSRDLQELIEVMELPTPGRFWVRHIFEATQETVEEGEDG